MKWGLVGTRGYAERAAAPGIKASARAELAAVLGSDPDRTLRFARAHGIPVAARSMAELLDSDVEAVWITSPTWLHADQGLAVIASGRHVLIEKPLAASSADAWRLVEAARSSGVVLATGYQARYVPGHRAMQQAIASEDIGRVTCARTYYGVHRPGPPPEWRQRRASARWGALADIATHHIDLLRMLLGEVEDATSLVAHQLGFETEDVAAAALRFHCGALATVTATVNVFAHHTRVEVFGTTGALVATDTSPAGRGRVIFRGPDGERDITGEPPPSVWAAQVDTVTAAACGEDVQYATGEDGARNVEILERLG